jgi:hypothetical protein
MCSALLLTACEAAPEESTGTDAQAPIEEMLVGRWMTLLVDGEPALTNDFTVFNIVTPSEVYCGISRMNAVGMLWREPELIDFAISGNVFSFTDCTEEGVSIVREFTLIDINETEFTANRTVTRYVDGEEILERENVVTFVRIDDDYSSDIIGTWEGSCTSEGSVFDDGQPHRWEYHDDGTFVYYVQDGDEWVAHNDGDYYVNGTLLCTRWFEGEVDNREWREITIDGDTMTGTALRANDDCTTFTATFEMTRVAE